MRVRKAGPRRTRLAVPKGEDAVNSRRTGETGPGSLAYTRRVT